MNESNLIPMSERTKEEVREIARRGGIKSGETRKKKKLIKDQIELLLSLPVQDKKAKAKLEALGIDTDNMDNQMAMVISIFNKAIKGDVSAFNTLRDTVGEKPKEVMEVTNIDGTIAEVEKYLGEKECKKNKNT